MFQKYKKITLWFKIHQDIRKMLKFNGLIVWRLGTRAIVRKYSSPSASVITEKFEPSNRVTEKSDKVLATEGRDNAGLVAAAFASLNTTEDDTQKPSPKSVKQSRNQILDGQILKAKDINSLLLVAENPVVSRRHALKMVSILSEWSSSNKVKLSDFERDPRFLKLCRILARSSSTQAMSSITMAEDLSTVLGITGDDEAARLIGNLSLTQMIKVMKALHQKGRRSTPLLRALSHNITNQSEPIDLKKSADLLFSMVSLNFPDPVLMDRICNDIIDSLPSNSDKPAVVNSIVVSLGLLKYRHEEALSSIAAWLQTHKSICRSSDIASAIITFGTLDFVPPSSESLFESALLLKEEEMAKPSTWLDLVFTFLTLDRAEKEHLVSTLMPDFIDKLLSAGEIPIPARRKLMIIDAYLSLKYPKETVRLAEDISFGVPIVYTKEKALYVQSIMDTFKTLVSAEAFLKRECYSGMGFIYDAEFAVDSNCHPVALDKAAKNKSVHRIAVLGLDYHDMTRKVVSPLGANQLYARLLEMKGFKVLQIPYTEFNPKDKLVARAKYIEKKLKALISTPSS